MFAIAMLFRLASWVFLKKMREPAYIWDEEKGVSFLGFVRKARKTNFGHFVLFIGIMNFSVFVAAPFFAPYMLERLGFNYLLYTVINAAATLATILTMKRWGVNSDIFGNRKVLGLTAGLIAIVPSLWVFSTDPLYLIAIQLFSGIAWAGFTLATANFVYDSVEPSKLAKYFAYQNVIIGAMVVLGAITGSLILGNIRQPFFGSNYLFLFTVSSALRLCTAFIFVRKIGEVRKVQPITKRLLAFKIVSVRPVHGIIHEAVVIRNKIPWLKTKAKS